MDGEDYVFVGYNAVNESEQPPPYSPPNNRDICVDAQVPHRPKVLDNDDANGTNTDVSIELHPTLTSNELLVSIQPPKKPAGQLQHTPCDIVLVIDVSGSMDCGAELPDNAGSDSKESSGLSILDLVKHAARTVLENLKDGDRLAVVTFSDDATRVQGLLSMTQSEKEETWKRIEELQPDSSTNLWSGIRDGLELFDTTDRVGNVQGMFILTDGAPNNMCPSQGYVKKLQPLLSKMESANGGVPILSTFGFGYKLKSDLLRSIAEVGRGTYAFIPESGMIGTVFVHAVANLFSTFATSVKLELETKKSGIQISAPSYLQLGVEDAARIVKLDVGNLQYGQSRDIVVNLTCKQAKVDGIVSVTLHYCVPDQTSKTVTAAKKLSDRSTMSQAAMDYHLSRHQLCTFLASLSIRNANNEYVALKAAKVEQPLKEIHSLIASISDRLRAARQVNTSGHDVDNLKSLLADLKSENTDATDNPHGAGQISLALQTTTAKSESPKSPTQRQSHRTSGLCYYERWGKHYLPSILHAHMRQQCATFKDPGPLRYGIKSPLFIQCRDELDSVFDRLPAPKPSLKGQNIRGGVVRMSRYNSSSNPCFAGHCTVKMANGHETRIDDLRLGDVIWTATSPQGRMVREIVKTNVSHTGGQIMLTIRADETKTEHPSGEMLEALCITPHHPIKINGSWHFPNDILDNIVAAKTQTMLTGCIYSILLDQEDNNPDAHVIHVGGIPCITLGHGLTNESDSDVRSHPYFGNYYSVAKHLKHLDTDEYGRRISGGVLKDGIRGLAMRFVRPDRTVRPSLVADGGAGVRARL